jgi:hypothetical protein
MRGRRKHRLSCHKRNLSQVRSVRCADRFTWSKPYQIHLGGIYPQAPNNPQYDMSGSGINMESGDLFTCTIDYDGSSLTGTLTDTVTNTTYTKTYTGRSN